MPDPNQPLTSTQKPLGSASPITSVSPVVVEEKPPKPTMGAGAPPPPPPMMGNTPPPPPPSIIGGPKPKKKPDKKVEPDVFPPGGKPKKKKGKIIATILVLLVLVVGGVSATILVRQQQDIRERADVSDPHCPPDKKLVDGECKGCEDVGGRCYSSDNLPASPPCEQESQYHSTCSSGRVCFSCPGTPDDGGNGDTTNCAGWSAAQCQGKPPGSSCRQGSGTCTEIGTDPQGNPKCSCRVPDEPTLSCECTEIKAFDAEDTELTAEDLANLAVGDVVKFAVRGSASTGAITKARFTINGTLGAEITGKQTINSVSYYVDTYTIPDGATSFSIKAELYHPTVGWF